MTTPAPTTLNINGANVTANVRQEDLLLYVLRDKLDLTGAKYGCGVGVCGACTSLVNEPITKTGGGLGYDSDSPFQGVPVSQGVKKFRPCCTKVSQVVGKQVRTIEGLGMNPVQQAWVAHDVAQCGYCQAGQIMTATELLERKAASTNKVLTNQELTDAMQANLCRCGTYPRIRAAIRSAAGAYGVDASGVTGYAD